MITSFPLHHRYKTIFPSWGICVRACLVLLATSQYPSGTTHMCGTSGNLTSSVPLYWCIYHFLFPYIVNLCLNVNSYIRGAYSVSVPDDACMFFNCDCILYPWKLRILNSNTNILSGVPSVNLQLHIFVCVTYIFSAIILNSNSIRILSSIM